jgi:hypothetical protein
MLARVRDVISAAAAPERHQPGPQVSELAAASRNGQPRAMLTNLQDPCESGLGGFDERWLGHSP